MSHVRAVRLARDGSRCRWGHFEREIVGQGMWNAVRDRLTEAGPETTLWASESEY
jgi:hypothetical protein